MTEAQAGARSTSHDRPSDLPLLRNPFFLREWWIYRRTQGAGRSRWTTNLVCILGPMAVGILLAVASPHLTGGFEGLALGWFVSCALWLLLLSYWAIRSTSDVFETERELGALPTVELTAVSARSEIVGRWAGNLLPVAEVWALGVLLVLAAVVVHGLVPLQPVCIVQTALMTWLFSALWAGVIGALALAFSAWHSRAAQAASSTVASLTLSFLGWGVLSSPESVQDLFRIVPLPGESAWHWAALPPQFTVFPLIALSPHPPTLTEMAFLATLWAGFGWGVLCVAASLVKAGAPLRFHAPQAQQAVGVLPGQLPATGQSILRGSRPQVRRWGLVDLILRRHASNPYYAAWRSGYMRLFPDGTAYPGSVVPPALVAVGVLFYVLVRICVAQNERDTATAPLVTTMLIMLFLACLMSAIEAQNLALRSVQAERNQATWPLLVVTGMTPERLVAGKFCACFYALCGEWTVMLPVWALLGILHPPTLLLAVFHPASIAVGALVGLLLAGEFRLSVRNALFAAAAVVAYVAAFLGTLGAAAQQATQYLTVFIDVPQALRLLITSPPGMGMVAGVMIFVVYFLVIYGAFRLLWTLAVEATRPSMLEPASDPR